MALPEKIHISNLCEVTHWELLYALPLELLRVTLRLLLHRRSDTYHRLAIAVLELRMDMEDLLQSHNVAHAVKDDPVFLVRHYDHVLWSTRLLITLFLSLSLSSLSLT